MKNLPRDRLSCMLVEFEDAVAELVPGTFIVCYGVEKLFKTINVQFLVSSSFNSVAAELVELIVREYLESGEGRSFAYARPYYEKRALLEDPHASFPVNSHCSPLMACGI